MVKFNVGDIVKVEMPPRAINQLTNTDGFYHDLLSYLLRYGTGPVEVVEPLNIPRGPGRAYVKPLRPFTESDLESFVKAFNERFIYSECWYDGEFGIDIYSPEQAEEEGLGLPLPEDQVRRDLERYMRDFFHNYSDLPQRSWAYEAQLKHVEITPDMGEFL